MKILQLDPSEIEIGWRARSDLGDVEGLAASIRTIQQINPITVSPHGKKYQLIAGARRLAACEQLNCKVVASVVDPRDEIHALEMQLQENIARKDFDPLEAGEGFKRLKGLYEAAHPETRHGAVGGGKGGVGTTTKTEVATSATSVDRFTKVAAKAVGCSERKIQELIQVADLPEEEKAEIKKAPRAERQKKVRVALRKIRVEGKKEKLRKQAEDRPVTEDRAKTVLHLQDNRAFFKKALPTSYDLILTDPPYETGRQSLVSHTNRGSLDKNFGAWDKLDVGWVLPASELLSPGGQILAFSPLEAIGDYKFICDSIELTWRGALIWHKTNPGTAHRPVYISSCEAIVWMTKGDHYLFTPFDNAGAPEAHNFIEGPICGGNERLEHPTQKPLWLLERLLRRHTAIHSRVLDPFCGVGSTLVACRRFGLEATGVELDPGYIHQAQLRLKAEK